MSYVQQRGLSSFGAAPYAIEPHQQLHVLQFLLLLRLANMALEKRIANEYAKFRIRRFVGRRETVSHVKIRCC